MTLYSYAVIEKPRLYGWFPEIFGNYNRATRRMVSPDLNKELRERLVVYRVPRGSTEENLKLLKKVAWHGNIPKTDKISLCYYDPWRSYET